MNELTEQDYRKIMTCLSIQEDRYISDCLNAHGEDKSTWPPLLSNYIDSLSSIQEKIQNILNTY